MCGVRTCATTRRDAFEFEHAIIVILPLSLLPPPPSPLFSRAKFEPNVRTTDDGPANSVGPPTEGAQHPAAVVTQWLSFFLFFFFVFLSHLFARRETVVLRAYHSPVPHHPSATASPHVASRHPNPAATPQARRLATPWKHVAPTAVVRKSSPRYPAPSPHPLTTQRRTLGTTALPSAPLIPPLRFGTPRHHGAQDSPPRHTTPLRRHIAASRRPATVHKPAMPSPARRLSRHANHASPITTTGCLRPPPYPLY